MSSKVLIGVWAAVVLVTLAIVAVATPDNLVGGSLLGVFAAAGLGLVGFGLASALDRRSGLDLASIFLLGLSLRWMAAVFVQYVVYNPSVLNMNALFAPDELTYDFEGKWWSTVLAGRSPGAFLDPPTGIGQFAGWVYLAFAQNVIVAKLLVCALGAWTAVTSALLGGEFDRQTGRRLGILTAVFPSLVLWTSMLLKDGFALFGALQCISAVVLVRNRSRSPLFLLLIPLGFGCIAMSRPYEMAFVVVALGAGAVLSRRGGGNLARDLVLFAVVSLVIAIAMQRWWRQPVDFTDEESPLAKVAAIRAGFAEGAGSALPIDVVDVRTPSGLILWIPIGLAYFFFAPFPFTGGSIISLATSPEMIYWYFLLPAVWRGLRRGVSDHLPTVAPLLLYGIVSSIGWSILVTNVGTIYRFRAQMLFVPLLFAAYDYVLRQRARPAGAYPALRSGPARA